MNTTLLFIIGMSIATFFAALMMHQALSKGSVLGVHGAAATQRSNWSPIGSALIVSLCFAVLALALA